MSGTSAPTQYEAVVAVVRKAHELVGDLPAPQVLTDAIKLLAAREALAAAEQYLSEVAAVSS